MDKIPGRWRRRVDDIGPRLVKRMRECLRGLPISALKPRSLLNELDDLLYSLHQNQGDEPFAFAKMWWLAALRNEEVEAATSRRRPASSPTSPLLERGTRHARSRSGSQSEASEGTCAYDFSPPRDRSKSAQSSWKGKVTGKATSAAQRLRSSQRNPEAFPPIAIRCTAPVP